MIPSVNYHLWEPCNMRCKFCFATFQDVKQSILPKGHLTKEQSVDVVQQLAEIGFEKITFAGGEPTLCPWLPDLIEAANDAGLTTMIVTNGSKLSEDFLQKNADKLDWIALSVDSISPATNLSSGRAICGKNPYQLKDYENIVNLIKSYGYGLKINTVVSSTNWNENMSDFIKYAKPKRWKIFQVLPIKGQNDNFIDEFKISSEQFKSFIDGHDELNKETTIIPESNNAMTGSYAMVDPAGRFYDNSKGAHSYSLPILEIGARLAIQQVNYDFSKFLSRGGIYNWTKPSNVPSKITISGTVGSGKTTIGQLLAEKLEYKFVSIGNKTRGIAEKHGVSIAEFQKECLKNPDIDKQIDLEFSEECNNRKNLVIDYRMGFKFIKIGFHIYLKISEAIAINRLKLAKRSNETHSTLIQRNACFKEQFISSYGSDYTDERFYNLVIDVDDFQSPGQIVDYIIHTLNELP